MTDRSICADDPIAGLTGDLARWQDEIELVNIELIFYKNLIAAHHREQGTWNVADYQNILLSIKDIQDCNEGYQQQFLSFSNELRQMDECQDLQCEDHFTRNYLYFKAGIEGHFAQYKQFKRNLFTFLKTRYNY